MFQLLWLVPTLPIAGSAILLLAGARFSRRVLALLACGSIALSALITGTIAATFLVSPPAGGFYDQVLWTWMDVAGFRPEIAFHLDALSLVMTLVVTFVAFLIHVYSTGYMAEDPGESRFFGYMNLFVGSMTILLLANNLLLLYLGWEGVGLCSYLLIGFWYQDPVNGRAARKAFIVTRVGDTAMALGLFLLFHSLGTLQIQDLMQRASAQWPVGSSLAMAAALLLLGGAVGKSAQLPLQPWLPDAMAGPTPTSALIHAATMVTAGVYLIARMHQLYTLAPVAQTAVAVIGAATLLLAGCSALVQTDIKRILAYSTMSQIGYMFLALGVGAWSAAIFHFMTHAFFKALLFLAAGVVIEALHHEQNIFRMGGLRRELPLAFWSFVAGGSALAGLPFVTSGYYSKDLIVWNAWAAGNGSPWLWIAGIAGVFLTSLYTYRLIIVAFFGELRTHVSKRPGAAMRVPLIVLAVLSIVGGFDRASFNAFLTTVLPPAAEAHANMTETLSGVITSACFLGGLLAACIFYLWRPGYAAALASNPAAAALRGWWYSGWGFDRLYDVLLVRPIVWFAEFDKDDYVDALFNGLAALNRLAWRALSLTETGRLRWYAAGIAFGSVLLVAVVLFL